ncbi:MAG: HAD-IA family hydrolase [Akkermansiaceae bacterium]|nr:HAD-IA family hydrolase [Akkermansiaceae bacterium]
MTESPLRALFFDFDGVIVDTEWAIYETWHQTFLDHGHSLPLETYNQCIGTDFNTWSPKTHLEELTGNDFDWHQIDQARQSEIEANLAGSGPMPGVAEAVAAARSAGLKLAVVSSSSHHWVDGWLEKINLLEQFDITVCRGDAARIKPAPDLYLEAARRLELDPAACLVVEDSINGLKAAIAAGMQTVAIPNRVTACCDFSFAGAVLPNAQPLVGIVRRTR